MKNMLMELLEVRNIIALLVAVTFVALAFCGIIEPKLIEYVIVSVFGFLFGAKAALDKPNTPAAPEKKDEDNGEGGSM